MFTWGAKFFAGISLITLAAAVVYGLVSGGDIVGVISMGYKGGVGDHLGYTILMFVFAASLVMMALAIIVRDGDSDELAARLGASAVGVNAPPVGVSPWGMISAFGVGSVVVGAAVSPVFFYLGLATLAVAGLNWLVLAWSDRATGDPEVNEVIRRRVLGPVEIPMLAMLGVAVIAVGLSRVFLATSATGAVVAGAIMSALVFGIAVVLSKVTVPKSVTSGIIVLGALVVLVGGIVGAAFGPRDFVHETGVHETGVHETDVHGVEGEGE